MVCSNFSGPPSAPGEPKIVDFDNKSVTLRWAKPKDTGGRPISHYIIQKKDKFGGWFNAFFIYSSNHSSDKSATAEVAIRIAIFMVSILQIVNHIS